MNERNELQEAWRDLVFAIASSLKIDRLVEWLGETLPKHERLIAFCEESNRVFRFCYAVASYPLWVVMAIPYAFIGGVEWDDLTFRSWRRWNS